MAGFRTRLQPQRKRALPPYPQRVKWELLKEQVDRLEVRHENLTAFLVGQQAATQDRYLLLDAQDWMDDALLDALWHQITRTAHPGARVLFRTAAEPGSTRRSWCASAITRRHQPI